jgi:hypothetical protein
LAECAVSVELEAVVEGGPEDGVHHGSSVEEIEEGLFGDMI